MHHHCRMQRVALTISRDYESTGMPPAMLTAWVGAIANAGLQHLDRYLALVLEIVGEKNSGHAAATHLALDDVAVGQGCSEGSEHVHGELGAWYP